MKKNKIVVLLIALCYSIVAVSQIVPTDIDGLSLWLSADSIKQEDGTSVEMWASNAEDGVLVSQVIATAQPTLVKSVAELNNKPVVRFDGNDYLNGGVSFLNIGKKGQTTFIVAKSNTANGSFYAKSLAGAAPNRYFFIYEDGTLSDIVVNSTGKQSALAAVSKLGKYDLLSTSVDLSGGEMTLFQQNVGLKTRESPITSNFTSSYNFLIGGYNNESGGIPPVASLYLNGDIAEMIFYDHALTRIERQSIENYLRLKYNLGPERPQFSLGNDTIVSYGFKPITFSLPDSSYLSDAEIVWSNGQTSKSIQVSQSGTYSVNVVDSWGYVYGDTIAATYPNPTLIQNQAICQGQDLTWDCGLTGAYTYLWSTGETTRAIKISEEGDYYVKITDNQGYSITTPTIHISIDSFALQASLGADREICGGNSIGLVLGAEKAVHYLWKDGNTNATITPDVSGIYSVVVTNVSGCVAKDTVSITVQNMAPIADFSFSNACESQSTVFTSNSYTLDGAQIVKNTWVFENDTLYGSPVEYTFPTSGEYEINLISDNDEGCSAILHETVSIHAIPQVSFSPSVVCQYTPREIVSLSTIAEDSIESYTWDVAGVTTHDTITVISSDTVGIIPMTLSITSNTGCTASFSDNIRVMASTKIEIAQTGHCLGDTLLFSDATQYSPYNQMQQAYWLLDGTMEASYSSMIWHKPTDTLSHTMALYVKTMNGCTNVCEHQFFVHSVPLPKLDTIYACVNHDIVLQNKGTSIDSITNYRWNVADSLLYDVEHPIFSLSSPGIYPLSLWVETEVACDNSVSSAIIVDKPPIAKFTFFPEKGAEPLLVTFTNKSESAFSYKWIFEGTDVSYEEHPEYLFLDKTTSYAKLISYSKHMCADSVIVKVPLTLEDERLQIVDFQTSIDEDGFISNTVQILNSGNVSISNMNIAVSSSDLPVLMEWWKGDLKPNDVLSYTFVSKQYDIRKSMPLYLCIDAEIVSPDYSQSFYSDRYCLDKTNDFTIYHVSPNPAKRKITLDFSTNERGVVTIVCVDEMGKIGMKEEFANMEPGYHSLDIDLIQLARGRYTIYIEQNNKRKVTRFIKE